MSIPLIYTFYKGVVEKMKIVGHTLKSSHSYCNLTLYLYQYTFAPYFNKFMNLCFNNLR